MALVRNCQRILEEMMREQTHDPRREFNTTNHLRPFTVWYKVEGVVHDWHGFAEDAREALQNFKAEHEGAAVICVGRTK